MGIADLMVICKSEIIEKRQYDVYQIFKLIGKNFPYHL